ncbi:MAG: rhodanese-like domain-containing protein [Candidatus Eisenbacteria bacterium]
MIRPLRSLGRALAVLLLLAFVPSHVTAGTGPDLALLSIDALRTAPGSWVILDARPPAAFHQGHIPSAHSLSWETYTRTDASGVPYQPWPREELAKAFGELGLTEGSAVLVYGDADQSWGGEGWTAWLLAWMGHQGPIRLLDGGIAAWREAKLPLVTDEAKPAPLTYRPGARPELDITTHDLRAAPESFALVDVRSDAEWLVDRIPGAKHIAWDRFHEGEDRRPLSPTALSALLAESGVNPERPVVYYCAGGIRSAYTWLVHQLSGLPPARNYEGGMEEWKRTP